MRENAQAWRKIQRFKCSEVISQIMNRRKSTNIERGRILVVIYSNIYLEFHRDWHYLY